MRLYIGNIPYTATESELRDTFSAFGAVSDVRVMVDRETQRPRGFAFVEMDDPGAQRAMEQLNGTSFGGRTLVVNQAKERTGGAPERNHRNGDSGGRRDSHRRDW